MFAVLSLAAAVSTRALLVAFLVALVIAVVVYAVGVYILHAPQPLVGIVAFVIFLLVLLALLPSGVFR